MELQSISDAEHKSARGLEPTIRGFSPELQHRAMWEVELLV